MHPAQIMTEKMPMPVGSKMLGYIDRHPADNYGIGWAVLRMRTGIEVAWDGERIRSLPRNWRDFVEITLVTHTQLSAD